LPQPVFFICQPGCIKNTLNYTEYYPISIESIYSFKSEVGMAGGWTADGAVQDQIDSTVDDAVQRARQALGHGESEQYCQECGVEIPQARRLALQGVRYCVNCQAEMDKKQADSSLFNRRGSKDSQLR
jgi:phage/conjugal plasmid C-4 type zinc finger TraR family protein